MSLTKGQTHPESHKITKDRDPTVMAWSRTAVPEQTDRSMRH